MPEVLIASLLLASSSSAALGVWSQALATWQQSGMQQQQTDELELLQRASHRWLTLDGSQPSLLKPDLDSCLFDAGALAAASDQAVPLSQGMTRRWVVDSDQLGVWQELSALNVDGELLMRRRQLVSPAAYGLCMS